MPPPKKLATIQQLKDEHSRAVMQRRSAESYESRRQQNLRFIAEEEFVDNYLDEKADEAGVEPYLNVDGAIENEDEEEMPYDPVSFFHIRTLLVNWNT